MTFGFSARNRATAILLFLSFSVPAAVAAPKGAMALDLVAPWPEAEEIARIAGEPVTFPSHSPFTLAHVGAGEKNDPPTTAQGHLFMPEGASPDAPVPAVIMLHGAGGVLTAREMTYGRQFAERGVAALVVDVFAARRDFAMGFLNRLIHVTEAMFLADAYAGLRFLEERGDIDMDRVALIGFSYGGMVSTYAAYRQVADLYARTEARFAAHVAFYAPCIADFRDSRATGAPLLMLYGTDDALVDPGRCAGVARALERGGSEVRTVVYPGAMHQWDGAWKGPRRMTHNLAACRFIVETDGTVRGAMLPVPMINPMFRQMILGLCVDEDGYLMGRDDEVRARSNRDMGAFLQDVLGRDR